MYNKAVIYCKRKAIVILRKAINKENLIQYAHSLKGRKFRAGIDNMTPESAAMWLEINGDKLCAKLLRGNYEPMPAAGFSIAKSNGKPRTLSALTAIDKIIQKALLDYIYDTVDSKFSDFSFAYRKNRGMTDALSLYCHMASLHSYAAKIDPYSCFDNIDFDILEGFLKDYIEDEKTVSLIMSFVKVPVFIEGELLKREKGLLQGAPLSALLCNVYLNTVDTELEQKKIDFIRYADDIIVFGDSLDEVESYVETVRGILNDKLLLNVNKNKFNVSTPFNIEFLGHKFTTTKSGVIADEKSARHNVLTKWTTEMATDSNRTVDIVSDGILRQKDYSILFETDGVENDIPVRETEVINIYSDVIFDSGFLRKSFDNGISINVFSPEDHLIGRFVPNTSLKSPSVIFEQLQYYYNDEARLALVKSFLLASFHNTRLVIRYYNKNKPQKLYQSALSKIDRIYKQIAEAQSYEEALLLEAKGREAYFGCFDEFLSESEMCFEKRTRKPPENEINAMISFGNVMLYNYIATEINKSPLDVRVGYLHATNSRKESLNLDIAEIFRPLIVDRTIMTLVNRRAINKNDFCEKCGGIYLNDDGKRKFIRAFYEKLDTRLQIKENSMSYRQIIREEVRKLVRQFREGEKYKPFKQVR